MAGPVIADPFKHDPLSSGAPNPMEGGMGNDALHAHMTAFLKAVKAGDVSGMSTAFQAAMDACYAEHEPEGDEGGTVAPPV